MSAPCGAAGAASMTGHTPAPTPSPYRSPTPALAVRRATRRQYLSNCHSL